MKTSEMSDVGALGPAALARLIDHTALAPDVDSGTIVRLCDEAVRWDFHAACVAPCWVEMVSERLAGERVTVATVIGFPHGNATTAAKAHETRLAVRDGARELDMVINLGALKSGAVNRVLHDVRAVVETAREREDVLVKVILETALLSEDEKRLACELSERAGADYVKTSTGFGPVGATLEDVALLRRAVGERLGVKAAGGIRDLETARAMLRAGASRLGCSASVAIVSSFG